MGADDQSTAADDRVMWTGMNVRLARITKTFLGQARAHLDFHGRRRMASTIAVQRRRHCLARELVSLRLDARLCTW